MATIQHAAHTLGAPHRRPRQQSALPVPVVVIGGGANALSIARTLGRQGVAVYVMTQPQEQVRYSRYCRVLDVPMLNDACDGWRDYLIGHDSDHLRGALLLSASDAGIDIVARHRQILLEKFKLDESNPVAQLSMLNKLSTYRAAVAAGVPTPQFWTCSTRQDVERLRSEFVYPLIVKPHLSHMFEDVFGAKFLVVQNFEQLVAAFSRVSDHGIEALLMEKIPGGDDQLCSYYTYIDEQGESLFDFSKRVIRRYPQNMGAGCYHLTDHNPQVREVALRLFQHVGLRGLANAEFKLDPRDGQLKLIECNARFTAANCLVARAGIDLASLVYNRAVGRPLPPLDRYRDGVTLWYPVEDFHAFRQLRRQGELSTLAWLKSILRPQNFPFFQWSDPWPTILNEGPRVGRAVKRRLSTLARQSKKSAPHPAAVQADHALSQPSAAK